MIFTHFSGSPLPGNTSNLSDISLEIKTRRGLLVYLHFQADFEVLHVVELLYRVLFARGLADGGVATES